MTSSTTMTTPPVLTFFQGVAYGLPLISLSFLLGSITLLQGIYVKYFGLGLTTIAAVLLMARLFDAVTDPLIGYYADRYYARWGHRKPFIIVGAVLFVMSSWFLFVPLGFDPEQGHTRVSPVYFLSCFLLFYLAYTLFEIPHAAWAGELAADSRGKNAVYGLRYFCASLGALLFFVMPLLPWFESTEFTPQILKWSVLVAGSLLLPALYLCIKHVPNTLTGPLKDGHQGHTVQKDNDTVRVALYAVFTNKPLLVLICAQIFSGFGAGMYLTLLFIFVDAYLDLGHQLALIFVISFSLNLLAFRLWCALANSRGKKLTWSVGMVLVVIGTVGAGWLSPESTGWFELLLSVVLVYIGFGAFGMMVASLLSDIVDYGTWKFGTDRAATYFSLYTFINKAMNALGGALALAIAGWVGFDATATAHSDTTIAGLRFAMSWIPAVFIVLSIVFITLIPMNERRHAVVRRRLNSRLIHAVQTKEVPLSSTAEPSIGITSKPSTLIQPPITN